MTVTLKHLASLLAYVIIYTSHTLVLYLSLHSVLQIWCVNALDAGPVVRAHLQEVAHGHAEPDPSAVTEQDVQDHLIPPALCEVGQEVHKEKLQKRKNQQPISCI